MDIYHPFVVPALVKDRTISEGQKTMDNTYRDAHDPLIVDDYLVVPVPLLTRRFAVRKRRDNIVQEFIALLDLARLRDYLQPSFVRRRALAPSQSATHTLWMEITYHDRVSRPDFDQHREKCAPRATRPTGSEAVFPISPPGNGRTPGVPGVLLITSAGGVVVQGAPPDPEGNRSEIIEAAHDLSESEGET